MIKVQKTKDYDQFIFLNCNREISRPHVNKLVESIGNKNLLPIRPISVSSSMEVIDGQHRLEAARALNTEIYYFVSDNLTHEDIINLNQLQRNWSNYDYLNYWVIKKQPGYDIFSKYLAKYPHISITTMQCLFSSTGNGSHFQFRKGNMNWEHHNVVDSIMKILGDYANIMKGINYDNMARALHVIHCVDYTMGGVFQLIKRSNLNYKRLKKYNHEATISYIRKRNLRPDMDLTWKRMAVWVLEQNENSH